MPTTMALTFRRRLRLSTRPGEDLADAASQLAAELAAKDLALELARRGEPEKNQPSVRYERDASFRGEFSELLVSFSSHRVLAAYAKSLGQSAWEAPLIWLPDEDPPHIIEITRTDDGLPAEEEQAREAIRGVSSCPLVLEPLDEPGCHATWLPPDFPAEQIAYMNTEDWAVSILSQKKP